VLRTQALYSTLPTIQNGAFLAIRERASE
jgi:hypothetical protein